MTIGIDARELFGKPTGVGRYLAELLERWKPAPRGTRFILYSPHPPAAAPRATAHLFRDPDDHLELKHLPGSDGTRWEQVTLRRALAVDRPDVLFAPAYTAPLGTSTPVVLTIHDVSFAAHPEWFGWREGARRRWITRRAARSAATILTVSEFSRDEIVRHLGVPRDRIRVVAEGVDARFSRPAAVQGREPLVLFVGSIFNRRRVPDLMAAFSRVAREVPDARLAIVGENRTHPRQDLDALARSLSDRISIEPYVTDDRLLDLYGRARVFVFLSEYEGFGLTPLEALAAGVPCVLLESPIARETCQDAALFVRPGDIEGTAAAIRQLMVDAASRTAVLERARPVLRRHSWDAAAGETLEALQAAGKASRP